MGSEKKLKGKKEQFIRERGRERGREMWKKLKKS